MATRRHDASAAPAAALALVLAPALALALAAALALASAWRVGRAEVRATYLRRLRVAGLWEKRREVCVCVDGGVEVALLRRGRG